MSVILCRSLGLIAFHQFQAGIKEISARNVDVKVATQLMRSPWDYVRQVHLTIVYLLISGHKIVHNEKQRPQPTDHRVSATQALSIQYPFMRRVAKSLTFAQLPTLTWCLTGYSKRSRLICGFTYSSYHGCLGEIRRPSEWISGLALALVLIIQVSKLSISSAPFAYTLVKLSLYVLMASSRITIKHHPISICHCYMVRMIRKPISSD